MSSADDHSDNWQLIHPPTDITKEISKFGDEPVSCGAFGDIYKGKWNEGGKLIRLEHRKLVAIKVIRPLLAEGENREKIARVSPMSLLGSFSPHCLQRLNREIALWQNLRHENILTFVGVSTAFGTLPSPISLWMANGIYS